MAKIDREELRALVRQALRDALGSGAAPAALPPAAAPVAAAPAPPGGGELAGLIRKAVADGRRPEISVALRTRDDADRFARDIAEASSEPAVKAAILAGSVRFVPVGGAPPASSAPPARVAAFEMTSGVLSETRLVEIARTHGRIVLGAGVVLTPLARDKAREMKIELTRQKP